MPSPHSEWILCGLLPASAAACIACHYADRRAGVYVFKPLTMLLALALALHPQAAASGYRSLVVAGLAASLAGDVLLMLPRDRFAAGLASFLLAHLLYIAAFAPAAGLTHPGLLLVFAAAGAATYALLHARLGRMRLPVIVYVAAIVAMARAARDRRAARVPGRHALRGLRLRAGVEPLPAPVPAGAGRRARHLLPGAGADRALRRSG
jgi:uncharacterized membrane protein YhhN